ncbi:MAG: hypothetical protein QM811_16075 [Pirellulales bacterium]
MLMALTTYLGLNVGDLPNLKRQYFTAVSQSDAGKEATLSDAMRDVGLRLSEHRLAGIGTAIFVMMVHSLAITYFVGTTRWCREVAETYGLAPAFFKRSQSNKRRNFPWASLGMLTVIVVAAFAALADGTRDHSPLQETAAAWMEPHMIVALLGTAFTAVCAFFEVGHLDRQSTLIHEMMGEVARIRREKGLETD